MREGILAQADWPMVKLGDVCNLISRGTAPNYDDDGDVHVIGQRCVQEGGFTSRYLKRHRSIGAREVVPKIGDVLLNSTGTGTIGRSCLFSQDGRFIVDSHVTVVRPGGGVDGRWIDLLFRSFWGQRYLESHCFVGSTGQVELSRTELASAKIPLPELAEQRKIADILDEVDAQIRQADVEISKLKKISHAVRLHSMGVIRMDSETAWLPIADIGEVKLGRQRSPEHAEGDFMRPYLRVANVLDGHIDYSDVLSMNFSPVEQERYELLPGDILLNEGQSLELVGRCALYDGPPGMFFQNTLLRFRSSAVRPEFARFVFKYWLDTGAFADVAKKTTSIAHLGVDRFEAMLFPIPGIELRERTVAALDEVEDASRRVRHEVAKLRKQKQALLDDLLTGRARVPVTV
ncbi:restriction endonuclease subunit S [Streptomyces pseudogriseolus]|uniref:restriction endonuclease subunit S n=1 Tax=Streptomyces pseudogriseolus TaxID=36817 RepID=UPI001CE2E6E6|nr:restriction endonuclease subunit S [Streptomyces pseudogriseolus]